MSHLNTAYNLGVAAALAEFEKDAGFLSNILGGGAKAPAQAMARGTGGARLVYSPRMGAAAHMPAAPMARMASPAVDAQVARGAANAVAPVAPGNRLLFNPRGTAPSGLGRRSVRDVGEREWAAQL